MGRLNKHLTDLLADLLLQQLVLKKPSLPKFLWLSGMLSNTLVVNCRLTFSSITEGIPQHGMFYVGLTK
jgi:hypothetical protein